MPRRPRLLDELTGAAPWESDRSSDLGFALAGHIPYGARSDTSWQAPTGPSSRGWAATEAGARSALAVGAGERQAEQELRAPVTACLLNRRRPDTRRSRRRDEREARLRPVSEADDAELVRVLAHPRRRLAEPTRDLGRVDQGGRRIAGRRRGHAARARGSATARRAARAPRPRAGRSLDVLQWPEDGARHGAVRAGPVRARVEPWR